MNQKTLAKYAKASAAFTSALLFGTERSDGLVKTLTSGSGETVRGLLSSNPRTPWGDRDMLAPLGTDHDNPMNDPFSGRYYGAGGEKLGVCGFDEDD